jgi:branched-chain amino acid transport system ATP-binding protein
MSPLLEIVDLTVKFGGLTAVDNITFRLAQGEVVSLIGPNGAGKTTLFNTISGIYTPTQGKIRFNGKDIARGPGLVTRTSWIIAGTLVGVVTVLFINASRWWTSLFVEGYTYKTAFLWHELPSRLLNLVLLQPFSLVLIPFLVANLVTFIGLRALYVRSAHTPEVIAALGVSRTFQNIRLFGSLSVIETVVLGMMKPWRSSFILKLFRSRAFAMKLLGEAQELLTTVGISSHYHGSADQLSYGDRRRLEIARALASSPQLLLLDEPAAGMNDRECDALVEVIKGIQARGVTIVLIEHHMRVVMRVSQRIVVLHHGKKLAEGNPEEIQNNTEVIDAYLGRDLHA